MPIISDLVTATAGTNSAKAEFPPNTLLENCYLYTVEAKNLTNPDLIALLAINNKDKGVNDARSYIALKGRTPVVAKESLIWTGRIKMGYPFNIWAYFLNSTASDLLQLKAYWEIEK